VGVGLELALDLLALKVGPPKTLLLALASLSRAGKRNAEITYG